MNKELIMVIVWLLAMSITLLNTGFNRKRTMVFGDFFVKKNQTNGGPDPCRYSVDTIDIIEIADMGKDVFISK